MCQLLGISSNREVDLNFSFREWRHRGRTNPHGYGFACWNTDGPRIVKAASSLFKAGTGDVSEVRAARSRMFLCHVRLATSGGKDGTNTHPFTARARGRDFVFAHNGTVEGIKLWPLRRHAPAGETDSEHAFLWIMEHIEDVPEKDFSSSLRRLAGEVRRLGRFNFLLSDGKTLWAYADNSLHFAERTPPYGGELVRLMEEGYAVSLAEVKRPDERAVIVATAPLTDEPGWSGMSPGELLVVRDGAVIERIG
ncbi:MAG: hypothetical protein A2V83_02360 [Nitrospirae bacterium RBG_16_64_22]|nr:MAG: hypothetical protein A2V83_02360 [Nitrospirae bacterium RBG_16_64_22]